jgi:hypothetical protein
MKTVKLVPVRRVSSKCLCLTETLGFRSVWVGVAYKGVAQCIVTFVSTLMSRHCRIAGLELENYKESDGQAATLSRSGEL